jgi:hypothetical protein
MRAVSKVTVGKVAVDTENSVAWRVPIPTKPDIEILGARIFPSMLRSVTCDVV